MARRERRIGLWLIGAAGGIGGTVALGLAALAKGLAKTTGLVTALAEFGAVPWVEPRQIVLGGHEIRSETLLESVWAIHARSNVIPAETIEACASVVRRIQRNVRPGLTVGVIPNVCAMSDPLCVRRVKSAAEGVEAIAADLTAFRTVNRLAHVVVVNVASSEPPVEAQDAHASYKTLWKAMARKGEPVVPASSIYAMGAFAADCSYINFTPSAGPRIPGILEFAAARDMLFMGRDGKTGETLLKSVLAPMFAMRNLRIHSWIGHNVLGNRDGEILNVPAVKLSKVRSKDPLVSQIVGYPADTRTSIEYVPSLSDWKVAWDYVHFEGFLNTKMNLQFVWTGSDSILAAPLVIDLVRLTALEHERGGRGSMPHLACFFKDPDGVKEQRFFAQWRMLVEHVCGQGAVT